MKTRLITFAIGTVLMAGCTKPPPPAPVPTPRPLPSAKPVPTPHPAKAARENAIRLYPDLAKKDSTFNRAFREIYEERKNSDPASLAAVDWPLDIARRAAAMLDVAPYSPTAAVPTPRPAKEPNALERGTYDQRRGVARPPVVRDIYGNRVPMR